MSKPEFKAARDLVDGDLIESRELPFRYPSEAEGYRSVAGDRLVRVGSEQGPHTPLGDVYQRQDDRWVLVLAAGTFPVQDRRRHGGRERFGVTEPPWARTTATTDWGLAKDVITGLSHLEGENVSVLSDGQVAANSLDTLAAIGHGKAWRAIKTAIRLNTPARQRLTLS